MGDPGSDGTLAEHLNLPSTKYPQLDIARHYYSPEFLVDMCSHLSFFKQNTFQLHLQQRYL